MSISIIYGTASASDVPTTLDIPSQSRLPTSQEALEKVLKRESAYVWEWTSSGIRSVQSTDKNQPVIPDEIYRIISDLGNERPEYVYVPIEGEKFDLVVLQRRQYLPELTSDNNHASK
jgi:hypothetical protein